MKTAKGSDVRRAVLGSIIVGLAVAAILVSPSAPAEPAGSVRVLNKNSSYDREVIAGERASAEWTVYNSGNISSYNVQASVVGSYGTWELSVAPQTFTITQIGRASCRERV